MLAVIVGGCVPSLHPLFTENELIFDSNLVGKWSQPNSPSYWEFKRAANNKYEVTYKDEKGLAKFEGMLGKIGSDTFLDLYPQDMNIPGNDFYKAHLIGGHTFLRVDMLEKGLYLTGMNPDNLDKLLKADPNAIKAEKVRDRIVLTASTKDLQAFVGKYSRDFQANIYGGVDANNLLQKEQTNSVK